MAPDGTRKKVLRYESLGEVPRKQASETLNQRITAAGNSKTASRSRVTFRTLAGEWDASVLPMSKHSTSSVHAEETPATLNVYTQVLDGSVRDAVEKIRELFTIVHRPERAGAVSY